MPDIPEFKLRFALSEVPGWAAQYNYPDPDGVFDALGPAARAQGHFTDDQYLQVVRWKTRTGRAALPHAKRNLPGEVEDITTFALTQSSERLRIRALTLLQGAGWPIASVLLHIGHPDPYPILDRYALWSLGATMPKGVRFEFWWGYVNCCRDLAEGAGVSIRTLDKALWTYGKHSQH